MRRGRPLGSARLGRLIQSLVPAGLRVLALACIGFYPQGARAAESTPPPRRIESRSPQPWRGAAELGIGLVGSGGEIARMVAGSVRGSYRLPRWAFGASVQVDGWRSELVLEPGHEWLAAANVGLTAEYFFLKGRARTMLTLGPSFLLGSVGGPHVGIFGDLRPIGLRFPVWTHGTLGLDPLGVHVLSPDLSNSDPILEVPDAQASLPIIELQFMSAIYLEWGR